MKFIIIGAFFAVTVASFIVYDCLIKIEYSKYYENWVEDGKPIGFFWVPKGGDWLKGSISRNIKSLTWAFLTQDWMKNDDRALKLSKTLRILSATGFVLWLLLIIAIYTMD